MLRRVVASRLSDIELLRIEIDTLWVRDEQGRLVRAGGLAGVPAPHLVIACATGGLLVAVGERVPARLAEEMKALVARSELPRDPATRPPVLSRCQEMLADRLGPLEVTSGPSYVAESMPPFGWTVEIRTAREPGAELLPLPPDVAGWTDEEWTLLMGGALGPWAVALAAGQIVSICFCARLTDEAAEAGVWTHPKFRGRQYAPAVTFAWAQQMLTSGRHVFYSTSAENLASQRVAARLGLRRIGWTWRIGSRQTADISS